MSKIIAALVALLMFVGAGIYYHSYYPPSVLKRETKESLKAFEQSVQTKDRAKVSAALQQFLTDDAAVTLEVYFFSLVHLDGGKPTEQVFTKQTFLPFIDNILYTFTDYDYHARLETFDLAPDRQTAHVIFSSGGWGDGNSYFAGAAVQMRFSANTDCDGTIVFENAAARLQSVKCEVRLHSAAKPGQEDKFQNPEAIEQLLTK